MSVLFVVDVFHSAELFTETSCLLTAESDAMRVVRTKTLKLQVSQLNTQIHHYEPMKLYEFYFLPKLSRRKKLTMQPLFSFYIPSIALSKVFIIFPTANSFSHSHFLFPHLLPQFLPFPQERKSGLCTPNTPSPPSGVLADKKAVNVYYKPSYAVPDFIIEAVF